MERLHASSRSARQPNLLAHASTASTSVSRTLSGIARDFWLSLSACHLSVGSSAAQGGFSVLPHSYFSLDVGMQMVIRGHARFACLLPHGTRQCCDYLRRVICTSAGKKLKDLNDAIALHVQELFSNHADLEKVVVPVGGTLIGAAMAWFVMPIVLRKLHKYASAGPLMTIWGDSTKKDMSYQTSLWSAMEDPAKYIITFMAFSQMAVVIAPSISDFLPQAWKGAFVVSFVWFLHRWKTNFIANAMAKQAAIATDRERLSAFDKVSSLGLIALGVVALAEACGVPVQSILTVGGVGGVATAFAARDILGNILSGFSLQFSRPFSVGDYIKAGSIEGQVVEIGLTSTSLINTEKLPVVVPNSLFSSQMIVNKSRAQWHVSVSKLPLRTEDIEKIPTITEEIKAMLVSNPKIDAPYCYLSRLEGSHGELTIGCNIKSTKTEEWSSIEQEILLKAAGIMKRHQLWTAA
ncbi:mechanosensitive ion channel protein 1, mitochondrial isoform X2 [Setaria viridis]|uniref:mechanosensitive ion channel protein 1, mitochondrial isoform X2 n=1 Tax=Setaria viridis TaxID=4556 RepID=UPI00149375D8|nr:mechanosensitive ion channel protein 1, mitochondrial-like isoform X4 [Setaria viridis]